MVPRERRETPTQSAVSPRRPAWVWITLSLASGLVIIVVALAWRANFRRPPFVADRPNGENFEADPLPLPGLRPARNLNTRPDANYVGAKTCVKCHSGEHESFLMTPHSMALGTMDDSAEPADGTFVHPQSTLAYSIGHQGDQTRHRIVLNDDDGIQLAASEFPVHYHIGSGNHSRSYIVVEGDFLFESPLTWYAARKGWDLSPGYNGPLPIGFDRMVDKGCLICHAGRVESQRDNRFIPKILEATIGCESCHGPGSSHVELWKDQSLPDKLDEEDLTIVNPARLPRDLAEQICSSCHLRGTATVAVRGRKLSDYRPGQNLSDFRIDYFSQLPGGEMTVTGHVEQMRLSQCYLSSPKMSCITCHDPHARPEPELRVEHFRQKCLSCHTKPCGLAVDQRRMQQSDDNCAACHMPRGETDIPHIAFTHHRIGIHSKETKPDRKPSNAIPQLVADVSLDHLTLADQLRCKGLAYIEISEKQTTTEAAQTCRETALIALRKAYQFGIRDASTLASLAGLAMERGDRNEAISLARAALQEPNADSGSHENARFVLANAYLEMDDLAAAETELLLLVQNRRRTDDWLVLAETRHKQGNLKGALEALFAAEKMNPFHLEVQRLLTASLSLAGQRDEAERHLRIEQRLRSRLRNAP